jgi:DNA-binding response OmpR family regulator
MRILVIQDHESTAELLREGLSQEGYAVDLALTGEDGQEMAEITVYDLLISDVVLPGKNGLEVCRSLRQKQVTLLILLMSDLDKEEDVFRGLDCGADAYLIKPFTLTLLFRHVRALLRRAPPIINPRLKVGDLELDTVSREVRYNAKPLNILRKESSMLELLMRNPDIVVTRTIMGERVWDVPLDSKSNVIDQHMKNLRASLADAVQEDLIETVRGVGYRLKIRNILKGRYLPCAVIFLLGLLSTFQLQIDWFSFIVGADV